jgi:GT2 family glycosyltransferase
MTKQEVSAVIPSFNCKKNLFRLIRSLIKSDYSKLRIIVVDNGSKDGTLELGRMKFPKVLWVDAGKENIGQTGCYNLGFAHADKESHILYIDSDVVVEKTMISNLVKRLDVDQKVGIVTPMILYLNDHNWVNQAGSYVDLLTGKVTVGWGPKKDYMLPMEVQNSGTVMLFRNKVVSRIGGVDNWFLCYFDPDYCLRAKKSGFITYYEPSAICYHDQSKNPDIWRPRVLTRAYLLGRNRTLFMRRHSRNLLVYTAFLPLLFGYYLIESVKYKILPKWFELIYGTFVGYFYPLSPSNKIPLPRVRKTG